MSIESQDFSHLFTNPDTSIDTSIDLPGYEQITTGEDTPEQAVNQASKALEVIKDKVGENFIQDLKSAFDDPKLGYAARKASEEANIKTGERIHDYMPFYKAVGQGIADTIKADYELDPSQVSVVVASESNRNWLSEFEQQLRNHKEGKGVVLVVFGNKLSGIESFRTQIRLNERLRDYQGWETIQKASEEIRPAVIGSDIWQTAVRRVMCIAKPQ